MFGLPGQTMDDWRYSLDALVALAPEHVTAYALTVERGTPFGALERAGKLQARPDDETVAAMYGIGHEVLPRRAFGRSNLVLCTAGPARRSQHAVLDRAAPT